MSSPKVLVLRAPGINCERETHHAFASAGGSPAYLHIQQLLAQPVAVLQAEIAHAAHPVGGLAILDPAFANGGQPARQRVEVAHLLPDSRHWRVDD